MQCSKCGQEVPADAIYCPHCTGDRKTTDRDVISGGNFHGQPVALTAQEFRLLSYLMHRPGTVVSRTELTEHLYAQDHDRDYVRKREEYARAGAGE